MVYIPGFKSIRHLRQKETLKNDNRAPFHDRSWVGIRAKVIRQTTAGGILFMLWFLGCLCYLYGTLYKSGYRHNNFHILAVDYDGGLVGQSMQAAYQGLKGPTFVTLNFKSPQEYPTEEAIYHEVWKAKYWGAIIATEGASQRLSAALQGGEAAATYNATEALHYIWDQQFYTTFDNSIVSGGLTQLVAATRIAYNKLNGTKAALVVNQTDPAAFQALLNPIQATARNIKSATNGSIILFNTVSIAIPIMQQFFFLLVLNGACRQHQLYNKMTVRSSAIFRRIAGLIFTFGAALCQTGYLWAFRESWNVNGNQFVLTWMLYWLLMHIHLLVFDSISSIAPLPAMPFVVLLWVFLNLASTLTPFEMQSGFYHWGIALPSSNAYRVLITIWTGGAANDLYRALPVMFSWWILTNITTSVTHWRACHLAYKLEHKNVQNEAVRAKDEEAALETPTTLRNDPISRQSTTAEELQRQRTIEEAAAMEQRQIYGPSIPSVVP